MRPWLQGVLIAQLLVHAWFGRVMAQPIPPEVVYRLDENSRRLAMLEGMNTEARLRVLESDGTEVKFLVRGVALAMIGQLVMQARRRKGDED